MGKFWWVEEPEVEAPVRVNWTYLVMILEVKAKGGRRINNDYSLVPQMVVVTIWIFDALGENIDLVSKHILLISV